MRPISTRSSDADLVDRLDLTPFQARLVAHIRKAHPSVRQQGLERMRRMNTPTPDTATLEAHAPTEASSPRARLANRLAATSLSHNAVHVHSSDGNPNSP